MILILGTSSDKDIETLAEEFKAAAATVVLTQSSHPRAYAFTEAHAKQLFPGEESFVTTTVGDALNLALSKANKDDVIVATGSIFVAAEVREKLCINTNL